MIELATVPNKKWHVLTDSRNLSILYSYKNSSSKYICKHSQILAYLISIKLLDIVQVNFSIKITNFWSYVDVNSL